MGQSVFSDMVISYEARMLKKELGRGELVDYFLDWKICVSDLAFADAAHR